MKSLIFVFILMSFFIIIRSQDQSNEKQHFCRRDKCLICVGKYCTITCRGENCKDCPDGTCCDSTSCNICRGTKCCRDAECNNCVQTCLQSCEGESTCHYDCFQKCLPESEWQKPTNNLQKSLVISTSKSYLPVNVTTVINITNVIDNENNINNPIVVNTTNIFNHTVDEEILEELQNLTSEANQFNSSYNETMHNIVEDDFIMDETAQYIQTIKPNQTLNSTKPLLVQKQNCCSIVHPRKCHTAQGFCYIAKHSECSSFCTAKHIHIIESKGRDNPCIFIGVKPYFYCGRYVGMDCSGCYICDNNSVTPCAQSSECPRKCRSALIPENLYNTLYVENKE